MMTLLEYETMKIKIERENEEKLKHYPILEEQLKIAVEGLKKGINSACPYYPEKTARTDMFYALKSIQKNLGIALQQIKDLNK